MKATIIVVNSDNLTEEVLKEAAQKAAEFIGKEEHTQAAQELESVKSEIRDFTKIADEKYMECEGLRQSRNILAGEIKILELRAALLEQEAKVAALKPKQPSRVAKAFKALSSHIAESSKRMPLMGLFTKPKQTA